MGISSRGIMAGLPPLVFILERLSLRRLLFCGLGLPLKEPKAQGPFSEHEDHEDKSHRLESQHHERDGEPPPLDVIIHLQQRRINIANASYYRTMITCPVIMGPTGVTN